MGAAYQRCPSTSAGRAWKISPYGASGEVCAWNRRRQATDGGAPGTVRPTAQGERFRIVITPSVIQRKGRRGRRPLRGVRDAGCSGAVRWAGSLGVVLRTRCVVCRNFGYAVARRVHRPRCTVAAGLPSWVRRTRPARPTAPASSTVHPLCVHNPTYEIPRAQPAHHFIRAHRGGPLSQAGRAWKPSPTVRVEWCQRATGVVCRPKAGRRGRRPLRWLR